MCFVRKLIQYDLPLAYINPEFQFLVNNIVRTSDTQQAIDSYSQYQYTWNQNTGIILDKSIAMKISVSKTNFRYRGGWVPCSKFYQTPTLI